jgi:hypothetical protein
LQADETKPIMAKYGLDNLEPEKWYPAHLWMDALNELSKMPNVSSNFVAIGMEIGKIVPMPPDMPNPTLGQVLMIWDGLYQYLHRNGDAGQIKCEKVSDQHYKTIHTDLYPDEFSYGILYGYARRFLPPRTPFKIYFDPNLPRRDANNAAMTVIHTSWE